jgi:hypothetical protein
MKQTAVDWLQETLESFGNKHELQVSWTTVDELFERAKEMEKQQIMNAVYDSMGTNFDANMGRAKLYYDTTFKQD